MSALIACRLVGWVGLGFFLVLLNIYVEKQGNDHILADPHGAMARRDLFVGNSTDADGMFLGFVFSTEAQILPKGKCLSLCSFFSTRLQDAAL